jgi:DNA-binding transcriptional LysR family regulator
MRQPNITGLDLKLVPALEALLRLRSVTQAAADLGLSQPAMSRALARLRDLQGDPLLVRTPSGYALTPRAQAIQPRLAAAMSQLGEVFHPAAFDPKEARRTLRLAAADTHTILILPPVSARLAREAPGVDLRVEAYAPNTVERIERGDLDLAFALSTTALPPGAYSETIGEDRLALVMRRDHPASGRPWTLEDYAAHDHVGVALMGDGRSDIDAILAANGLTRRMALVTPHFMAALAAVAVSDQVTTISAALAGRFADTLGLVLLEPPFGDTRLETTLVSSHVRSNDPFLAWFRDLAREVWEIEWTATSEREHGAGWPSTRSGSRWSPSFSPPCSPERSS